MNITMQGKYQTRDGRAVTLFRTDVKDCYPVVGIISQPDGTESLANWSRSGRYIDSYEGKSDLIPVPMKHEGWTYINPQTKGMGVSLRTTRGEAVDEIFCPNLVVAHVTWED